MATDLNGGAKWKKKEERRKKSENNCLYSDSNEQAGSASLGCCLSSEILNSTHFFPNLFFSNSMFV